MLRHVRLKVPTSYLTQRLELRALLAFPTKAAFCRSSAVIARALSMSRHLFCVFACLALGCGALRASRDIAGDQPPQLYPAVTVHVPEPAGDAPGAQARIDLLRESVAGLDALEQRVAAQEHADACRGPRGERRGGRHAGELGRSPG